MRSCPFIFILYIINPVLSTTFLFMILLCFSFQFSLSFRSKYDILFIRQDQKQCKSRAVMPSSPLKGGDCYGIWIHNFLYDSSFTFSNFHKKITPTTKWCVILIKTIIWHNRLRSCLFMYLYYHIFFKMSILHLQEAFSSRRRGTIGDGGWGVAYEASATFFLTTCSAKGATVASLSTVPTILVVIVSSSLTQNVYYVIIVL